MAAFKRVFLKPGKEAALLRFHPWVFSGAIRNMEGTPGEGEPVEVCSHRGAYLGTGHFSSGSIAVKIFSFTPTDAGPSFWLSRLGQALELRNRTFLGGNALTNAYRLVFSEGDGLPGLIIDNYNGIFAIQAQSAGMYLAIPRIIRALRQLFGEQMKGWVDKSEEGLQSFKSRWNETEPAENEAEGIIEILETGHRFRVDIRLGQKTGFFLDQRSNRMFAQFYARGRSVLNAFCYTGAFSVYTLKGGATRVVSVDSSKQAIEWAKDNILMNLGEEQKVSHEEIVADVKQFLPQSEEKFDLIILDPPAFAKTHRVTNNALQAYVHINAEAMKKLNPGGILFTFSCSQAISREMFRSAIQSAAIETGRSSVILHQLSQGLDHPVSIFHPEGEYLKGYILAAV